MAQRRLSLLDTNFLQMETPTMHMHVGALMIFEQPENASEDFTGEVVQRFRDTQVFNNPWNYRLSRASRLQFFPLLREVHDVDMEYHVRHLALPKPGGERELGQLIARLHSQPLDKRKPLWEVHVIQGLENKRFAIYLKIHHCLIDGHSGTILISQGLSPDPDAPDQQPWWAQPSETPGGDKKLKQRGTAPGLLDMGKALREVGANWLRRPGGEAVSLRAAPRTMLNQRLHSQRRFATQSIAMGRIKAISKAADATLNDVVLALTGAALRDYLDNHGTLPDDPLIGMLPVSLHEAGSKTIENNITMIFSSLGTDVADDRKRLETVKASVQAAKDQLKSLPIGTTTLYSTLLLAPIIGNIVSPLSGRSRPLFNTVVSNVRGPSEDLYLYGARLAHLYPVSIPFHGAGLNVTCFSNAGNLNFGFTACRDTAPHMQQVAVALGEAVDRLEAAYGLGDELSRTRQRKRSA